MAPLSVVFLGTGDAFSEGGRNQSGYLVRGRAGSALLDCGATALASLKRAGFRSGEIGAILISHFHGDHFSGLPFILLDGIYSERRSRTLTIAGPPGVQERSEALFWASYRDSASKSLPIPVTYVDLRPGPGASIGEIGVETFRVPHQGPEISLAFRVTIEGKRILYSGDAGWTEELVEFSQGTDLFICECSFFDTRMPSHLDFRRLAENRSRFGSKRMILTHLGAEVLAHLSEIDFETAHDGQTIEI